MGTNENEWENEEVTRDVTARPRSAKDSSSSNQFFYTRKPRPRIYRKIPEHYIIVSKQESIISRHKGVVTS